MFLASRDKGLLYNKLCDTILTVMTHMDLKQARVAKGLTQAEAARRLGVSQPYVAMLENGNRRLTRELARRLMAVYELPATAVPPSEAFVTGDNATLARDLAALGYPGFSHLCPRRWRPRNPSEVLLAALSMDYLEPRLAEALPWLVLEYEPLEWDWLLCQAKLRDLQNRLGFVVTLARRVAERTGASRKASDLRNVESELERSRLAREDTFCNASLPEPERRWLAQHRSSEASHWNLLTDWSPERLRYVA